MIKLIGLILIIIICAHTHLTAQSWTNPITLSGEWESYGIGDPYIMKYRGTYYLYCSTKDNNIGVKCWSSKDLRTWAGPFMCSADAITNPAYTPTLAGLIPTGQIAPVANTAMDFSKPTAIGARVNENTPDLTFGKGYDHNWVLNKNGDQISEACNLFEPETGIALTVYTDQPAIQFYGGNFFNGTATGKYGEVYTHRSAFVLETQHFPDSPNHANFPNTILLPGKVYTQLCMYKFSVR